ncbi:MAG: hypothetical protein H6574_02845 [Lewinellaceae bacterium]|nr:hypothetical protein [Lewinellaceae bacterium]
MENSGLFKSAHPILKGYKFTREEWLVDSSEYSGRYASGGCYSTIKDMRIFGQCLVGNSFLNPGSKELLKSTANKIEIYGSLPGNSNMFILDFKTTIP